MAISKRKSGQWRVTAYGLEATIPNSATIYPIPADELLQAYSGTHDWQMQLAAKSWVDIEQFFTAFDRALKFHKGRYKETIDRAQIMKNRARARQIAAQRGLPPRRGGFAETL